MKRLIMAFVVIWIMFIISIVAVNAFGATATFNAPSTNVDGSPLTDLAGYKLYCIQSIIGE